MAKKKSDISKLKEGRCSQDGSYVGFVKASEGGYFGTAAQIYDPIANRMVDTLSEGETWFFFQTRWDDSVEIIEEQRVMAKDIVDMICEANGFRKPKNLLTTDFLITYKNGIKKAFSVKASRDSFNHTTKKSIVKDLRRQLIEKLYWEHFNIEWTIIYKEDLDRCYVANIEAVLQYYNVDFLDPDNPETIIKHLIAHKKLIVEMKGKYLNFTELASSLSHEEIAKALLEIEMPST